MLASSTYVWRLRLSLGPDYLLLPTNRPRQAMSLPPSHTRVLALVLVTLHFVQNTSQVAQCNTLVICKISHWLHLCVVAAHRAGKTASMPASELNIHVAQRAAIKTAQQVPDSSSLKIQVVHLHHVFHRRVAAWGAVPNRDRSRDRPCLVGMQCLPDPPHIV